MSKESQSDDPTADDRAADGRFVKGHSGGPGRPRKVIKVAADILDHVAAEAAADVLEAMLKQAREGNMVAAKMILERIWPVGHARQFDVAKPEMKNISDQLALTAAVTRGILVGEVTPQEGAAVARLLDTHMGTIERHQYLTERPWELGPKAQK